MQFKCFAADNAKQVTSFGINPNIHFSPLYVLKSRLYCSTQIGFSMVISQCYFVENPLTMPGCRLEFRVVPYHHFLFTVLCLAGFANGLVHIRETNLEGKFPYFAFGAILGGIVSANAFFQLFIVMIIIHVIVIYILLVKLSYVSHCDVTP